MLALRCSRNAASRSRPAASRCITLTSRFHHTCITLASRCITPASRYISTQANLCRRRTNRRARGRVGEPPPPERLNYYASPIDKTIDDSTQ
jgi:hypothetical protein